VRFDAAKLFDPRMDVRGFNFYYEADARHNPGRGVVWTDAYVDPHYKELRRLASRHPDALLADLIETHYGRRIAAVEQTISGCVLEERLAGKLEAASGAPGLKILRQYRDAARAVVLTTCSIYPADRYSVKTTLVRNKPAGNGA